MRKVFWCSLAGGMVLSGAVVTIGLFAARNPQSFTGRAVIGAGSVVVNLNSLSGYSGAVSSAEPLNSPITSTAVGGEEQAEPTEKGATVEIVAGAIRIPESETVAPTEPVYEHLIPELPPLEPLPAETEVAPPEMPLCEEDLVETTTCETLHMPATEDAGEEEQEEQSRQGAGTVEKLLRMFEHATRKSVEGVIDPAGAAPECREDLNRHHYYSGCPYSGPCPSTGGKPMPSTPEPTRKSRPAPIKVNDEGEGTAPEGHSSALRSIRRSTTGGLDETMPKPGQVDTMEFRTSDGKLYDFGPSRKQ